MACWNKTKVHVAGAPLSSVADCRLCRSIVGCDDVVVVVVVGHGKAQLVLLPVSCERTMGLSVYGTSSPAWKRG